MAENSWWYAAFGFSLLFYLILIHRDKGDR